MNLETLNPKPWLATATQSRTLDFLLSSLGPQFSLRRHMARILSIREECSGTHTLTLQPDLRWPGFVAGQHVGIQLDVDGVRYHRTYSLSCSPQHFARYGQITLTIKGVAGGHVSPRVAEVLQVGEFLEISEAKGEFTWENRKHLCTEKTLMMAAGSGITPIKSLLDELADTRTDQDVVLLFYVRQASEQIFTQWLAKLTDRLPRLRTVVRFTNQEGEITAENLLSACPDLAEREVFLCGPSGFMESVKGYCQSHGLAPEQIHSESFGGRRQTLPTGDEALVYFEKSGKSMRSTGSESLLELAERAGLKPKYGCRSGICHECKCQRGSGSLINALTGQPIPDEQQQVQACIAIPNGTVTIPSL